MPVDPRRKRTDENHSYIGQLARDLGADTVDVHEVANFVDWIVGFRGETHLWEVKTESGKLRRRQRDFHRTWRGKPIEVIRNEEDVYRSLGLLYLLSPENTPQ